jgi:outer membrane receptor protein involved in Fe transport
MQRVLFTCAILLWVILASAQSSAQVTGSDSLSSSDLQQVIISASRTAQKRIEAPVAITVIGKQTMEDTKANRLDYLVNKVSGVFMVNLGNEQHEMSIRQPMTTRSLFLYLEDGIPIRTTGIYNHNALLEMNTTAAKQLEIIKGPASSAYGAEAIGGAVNVITQGPPAVTNGYISLQGTNNGYKRADVQAGTTVGKLGLLVSGYYADRNNGPVQQSDFHKTAVTLRADYKINSSTSWSNSATYVNYYSDMGGGSLDSAHFAQKNYTTQYTFNNRKVTALRIRSTLTHQWKDAGETQLSAAYRDNSVGQNPSYYVTNVAGNPLAAKGQINNSSFKSYMLIAQHVMALKKINSHLVAGLSMDISPSGYIAHFINITRNSKGDYVSYQNTDSLLSNYKTGISNLASYINYDYTPFKGMKLVAALRYDHYHYNFTNWLLPSASTGAPSTINDFNRVTPKLGLTYNYRQLGFYANYSQGYVPPQVTELFNSVQVPYLLPQTFYNYEIGGWLSLLQTKLYLDWSLYLLKGTNEIISVRQNDGSYQNQNAGKTNHQGIEYGITYKPTGEWMLRVSATNAKHTFLQNVEKGIDYSGHEMAAAPHFIANAEMMYKPRFIKGLRIGVEWQHQGRYWMDNANSASYPGFDVINLRAGYRIKRFEVWVNALNVFNQYYAVIAARSTYGYTYNLGDPREFTTGVSFHFGKN